MDYPIIFIHKGDSFYLKYTFLNAAKYNNVIILGDDKNKKYMHPNITHYNYQDILPESTALRKSFKYIKGDKFDPTNSKIDWVYFNFYKWFMLEEFLSYSNISKFWIFDSDTLILENLKYQISKFSKYDYTTHNNNNMFQGLINNRNIINIFNEYIIKLFNDKVYLKNIKCNFNNNPHHAFTYMKVCKYLNYKLNPNNIRLNTIINNEIFDECICFNDGFKKYLLFDRKNGFRKVKKVYFRNNNAYLYNIEKSKYIKLVSINLSWVPELFFDKIIKNTTYYNPLFPFIKSYKTLYPYNNIYDQIKFSINKAKRLVNQFV